MDRESPEVVALRKAVESIGSQSAFARLLDISQQAVSKLLRNNRKLPPQHVLVVEAATGISKHDLRADIYPRPRSSTPATAKRADPFTAFADIYDGAQT